ncbi:heat repeat-containing protein, partial [Cystoisospora suis]
RSSFPKSPNSRKKRSTDAECRRERSKTGFFLAFYCTGIDLERRLRRKASRKIELPTHDDAFLEKDKNGWSTVHNLPTSSPYESLPFGAFSRPFSSSSSCSLPRNSTPGCTSLPSSSSSFGKSSESRLLCIHSPIPPIPEALRQARIEARALWEKHRISQTEDERSTTTTEADGGGSAGGLEGGDEGEGQRSIKEGEKKKKTHTTDRKKTSSHGDRDDVASKEAFNKFFSDDANERLLGAASIRFLAELLGPSRHELFSFLTTFLDTEDNRLVLEMIGRELADLLSEEELSLLEEKETENGKRVPGEGGEKEDMQTSFSHRRQATVDEAFLLFSLLSTLLTGHDRAIRETALAGVHRLFRFHALEPRRTKNRYFSSSDDREQIQTFPEGEGESTGLSSRRKSSQGSSLQRGGGNHVHLDRGMCLLIANMSTNQAILPNVLLPSIYHMTARDGNARYQIASVLLLPLTAYYLQIFLVELESLIDACRPHEAGVCTPSHGGFSPESNGEGEQEEKNEVETPVGDLLRPFQANLQRQIESIVDDYIRLCTDESALHMQLQAGGQLPVFIAYCSSAAVMHYTQRRKKKAFAKKKTSKNSSSEETGKKGVEEREKDSRGEQDEEEDDHDGRSSPWGAEEKRILHLLYEAVSSFVRSSSDTLKMVGVEALAAMADRGPLSLFKSVVDNLLPMLCASTPSDEIDALLKKRESSKKGEENEKEENDEDGCSLPSASLGSGTCLVSVLVQFLKDRE